MSILDKKWKYAKAQETCKPGYLRAKFAQIRKQHREQAEQNAANEAERREKIRALKGAK